MDNDFGHWDSTYVLLNFTFVDEKHPKFEKQYKKVCFLTEIIGL